MTQMDTKKFVTAGKYKEIVGSTLAPEHARLAIIFIPVSVSGEYSSPLYDKVTKRWAKVRQDYREKFVNREKFQLGETIITAIASDMWVAQALCLNVKDKLDKPAFETCLNKVIATAKYETAYLHTSQKILTEFPYIKKIMTQTVPAEGLYLYGYSDDEELVKR